MDLGGSSHKPTAAQSVTMLDGLLLASCLLLLRLPVAFGYRQSIAIRALFLAPLVPLLWKTTIRVLHRKRLSLHPRISVLLYLYTGVVSISFLRTFLDGSVSRSVVLGNFSAWFIIAFLAPALFGLSQNKIAILLKAVFLALWSYVTLNVILYLIGITSPEQLYFKPYSAVMLSAMGLNTNRVLFPTASGINAFGAIGGALLCASMAIVMRKSSGSLWKLLGALGVLIGLFTVLATDSRAALFFSVLTGLVIGIVPRRALPAFRFLPYLTPLLPILFFVTLTMTQSVLPERLARGNNSLANMSNRVEIWRLVTAELQEINPIHFIGYGYRGQVVSGLSMRYIHFFESYARAETASAHNIVLQSVLEIGYLGTLTLLVLLSLVIGTLVRTTYLPHIGHFMWPILAILVYMILLGTTGPSFSPDYQELQIVFLLCVSATAALGRHCRTLRTAYPQ